MIKIRTKKLFRLLTLISLLLLFATLQVSGKVAPDRNNIYGDYVKTPVSNEYPIFLTKFFEPAFSPSVQTSKLAGFTDLLISESVAPATFRQRNSDITRLSDGRTVIAWTDDRNGNQMIFVQLFDSDGNRTNANILAIGREDQNDVSDPHLVSDGSGGFYLGWRDNATNWIFASRFHSDLTRDSEFRINNPVLGYAGLYDLAPYPGGKLVAVWEQYFTSNSVNLRVFSSDGTPLTQNITVNDDGGTSTYKHPKIAVEPTGKMAIAWEDYRNGNADIYMQFVNTDGSLYGSNRRIIDFDYLTDAQYLPEIAFSATDGYIIAWLDKRSGTQRVFLQRLLRAGLIGSNVNISNNAENFTDWYISMAVNSSGNLAVAWSSVNDTDKVLIQKFSSGVVPDGPIITVSDFDDGSKWETSLAFDNSDNLYCSWSDSRRGNWDIMLKQYDSEGSSLSENDIIVNDDTEGAHSTQPAIDVYDQESVFVAAYMDKRNDDGDIFWQLIPNDGIPVSASSRANSDNQMVFQTEPDVSIINVDALIVWNDSRAINGITGQRIMGSHLVLSIPYEGDIIISDTSSITSKASPSVATLADGTAIVSWIDYQSGDGQILSRKIGYQINGWSDIFEVSDKITELNNIDLNVMSDNDNIFTIAWLSQGIEGGPSTIFSRFNSDIELINKFSFISDQTGQSISKIATALNANGDIYLLWLGEGTTDYLYLTVFNKTGAVIHPTYEITGGIGGVKEGIDIAVDYNGVVCATWVDDRDGRDEVFYQIFYPDLTPFGENTPASPTEQRYMKSPTVAMDGQQAVIAWVDPRANGHNVYMSQIDYNQTDIEGLNHNNLPAGFSLEQNYPNPFNPTTSIQFSLPSKSHVKLEIYNLLGRKIATITDKLFESGIHSVNWDGTNSSGEQAASGIYFYRIGTDQFEQSRKMILLK